MRPRPRRRLLRSSGPREKMIRRPLWADRFQRGRRGPCRRCHNPDPLQHRFRRRNHLYLAPLLLNQQHRRRRRRRRRRRPSPPPLLQQ